MQAPVAQADGVTLACSEEHGADFTIRVPAWPRLDAAEEEDLSGYRVTGLDEAEMPDTAVGSLDDALWLVWRGEGGEEIMLDIIRYNAAAGTARYRIRRESTSPNGITSITSSSGTCVRRQPAGETS